MSDQHLRPSDGRRTRHDRQPELSDEAIAGALTRRVPHGPDPALLPGILTAATATPQLRAMPWPSLGVGNRRRQMLWLGIAFATVATLVSAMVIAGGGRRDLLSVLSSPDARASLTAPASGPPAASPGASATDCATDHIQVLQRPDMPKAVEAPADLGTPAVVDGHGGAYLTGSGNWPAGGGMILAGGRFDLWTFGPTGGKANRIAVLGGPGVNTARIAGTSSDGGTLYVILGTISPSGGHPECTDLYAVHGDGSPPDRLSRVAPGTLVTAATGGEMPIARVEAAYVPGTGVWERTLRLAPSGGAIPGGSQTLPCASSAYVSLVEWSPRRRWIAVDCPHGIAIVDPSNVEPARMISLPRSVGAIRWVSDSELAVAETTDAGPRIDVVDARTGAVTAGQLFDPSPAFEWVEGPGYAALSPDGRWLYAEGTPHGAMEQVGYVVATTGGTPRQVLAPDEVNGVRWDTNGRLLFLHPSGPGQAVLVRLEPATGKREALATFPSSVSATGIGPVFPVVLLP